MFVIWGAGLVGKRIYDVFGGDFVVAFIDSNYDRHGQYYLGKPVISLAEYLNCYTGFNIVIAVKDVVAIGEIEVSLQDVGVKNFYRYTDIPVGVLYGEAGILDRLLLELCADKDIWIYGKNLYTMLVTLILENRLGLHMKNFSHGDAVPKSALILYCCSDNIPELYGQFLEYYANSNYINAWNIIEYDRRRNILLEKFRNIHVGKRCFIIATGPSLRLDDLEILANNKEISFSVNNVYRSFDKTSWRPTYYVAGDRNFQKIYGKEVWDIDAKCKFIADMDKSCFRQVDGSLYEIYLKVDGNKNGLMKVSDDITRCIYGNCYGGSIVHTCLQIAMYMGFKEIYLLGTDCSYDYDGKHHFVENYFNDDDNYKMRKFRTQGVFEAYQAIKYYAETHGIKIYNATRGGILEIFERVEFDELFPG